MIRTTLLSALAAASFLAPGAVAPSANVLIQEPLVVFDVSGYGLAGVIHEHLAVYNNGAVSISSVGGGTALFPLSSKADFTYVTVDTVRKLWGELVGLNAFAQVDQNLSVADLPMTTVSIFRGETDARAHTFSYWIPTNTETDKIRTKIQDFIQSVFPGF